MEASLLRLLGNLQRRYGKAYASEASLRRMICEDTGLMPGLDTVRRALRRFAREGTLRQKHLVAGGILPDGNVCTKGTREITMPHCRRERRAMVATCERVSNRVNRRALQTLAQARASAFRPRELPDQDERAFERKRQEALSQARELAASWAAGDGRKPAPE